jgi:hypothetical protein
LAQFPVSQKIRDPLRDRSITTASQSGAAQTLSRRNQPAGGKSDRAPPRATVMAGHPTSFLVPVVMLGVVSTAIAYALGISGVARPRPSYASLMGLGEVLCAVVIARLLLGEATPLRKPSAAQWCCWDWHWPGTRTGSRRTSSRGPAGPTPARSQSKARAPSKRLAFASPTV